MITSWTLKVKRFRNIIIPEISEVFQGSAVATPPVQVLQVPTGTFQGFLVFSARFELQQTVAAMSTGLNPLLPCDWLIRNVSTSSWTGVPKKVSNENINV